MGVVEQVEHSRDATVGAADDENAVRIGECEVAQCICYVWKPHCHDFSDLIIEKYVKVREGWDEMI